MSARSSEVGTEPSAQVRPPSVLRAKRPLSAVAYTSVAVTARSRPSLTWPPPRREPLRVNEGVAVELPASGDATVVPASPTPTAAVGEENEIAKIFSVDGLITVTVVPPSVVRSTRSPERVAIRQTDTLAQRICVRSSAGAPLIGMGVQVSPPSVVFSRVLPFPTAYPVVASTNSSPFSGWFPVNRGDQEPPPSVVR